MRRLAPFHSKSKFTIRLAGLFITKAIGYVVLVMMQVCVMKKDLE